MKVNLRMSADALETKVRLNHSKWDLFMALISSYRSQFHNQSITGTFSILEFFGFQVTCILIIYIL